MREACLDLLKAKEPEIAAFDAYLPGGGTVAARSRRLWYALRRYGLKGLYYVTWLFPMVTKARAFWGKDIYIDLPEDIAVVFFGALPGFELPLTKFLVKNLKDDSVFYDVGAHIGFYSALAKEFVTAGEIHSFEANPCTFKVLVKNADRPNMTANLIAVADVMGEERDYYADPRMSGMSGFRPDSRFKKIIAKTTTLDDYAKSHRPPTIMKIDVEGFEEEVLAGARAMIAQAHPVILMELWKSDDGAEAHGGTIGLLAREGYRLYGLNKEGDPELLERPDQAGNLGYDNFVFMRP
ncbi:MAG TPA: FkbM family methyltransferase [Candidatus Paceibacterota bacterium]|nr:FkbM family methyltransferase [Candidatus Paceibacterota bacterium]